MWYKTSLTITTNYLLYGKSTVIIRQIALRNAAKALFLLQKKFKILLQVG